MKTTTSARKMILIGLTGSGKSRFGNRSSGFKKFNESSSTKSCTKGTQTEINQFGVEITDTQGLDDTDKEDKQGISSLFNSIKQNKPNIIAYVHNCANKRFVEASEKAILEICKMFKTKTVWNHFILIFTYGGCISKKEKRDKFAQEFMKKILEIINKYYKENNVNDNLPIPTKLLYYFVELGDDDEDELDEETVHQITDVFKQTYLLPPLSDMQDKIIVEIRHKRNCRESVRKYNREIVDNSMGAKFKRGLAKAGGALAGVVAGAATGFGSLIGVGYVASCFVTGGLPVAIVGMAYAVGGLTGLTVCGSVASSKIDSINNDHSMNYCIDENTQNEDYITFDEETYVYHDGTTETRRINVESFTRVIAK